MDDRRAASGFVVDGPGRHINKIKDIAQNCPASFVEKRSKSAKCCPLATSNKVVAHAFGQVSVALKPFCEVVACALSEWI